MAELLVRDDKAQSRRGDDPYARTDRKGQEFRGRRARRQRAARRQRSMQDARRDLRIDQPVRHDQRGRHVQPLHLPRRHDAAHDNSRRRQACLPPKAAGKRVAYLVADYTYGHEGLRAFKRNGEQFGMQTVEEILHPLGTQDFSTFFLRILAAKPDVVCICNFGRDQLNSIKQAVDFGIKKQAKIAVPVFFVRAAARGIASYVRGCRRRLQLPLDARGHDRQRQEVQHGLQGEVQQHRALRLRRLRLCRACPLLAAVKAAGKTDTGRGDRGVRAGQADTHKGPEYYRKCDHQAVQPVFVVESKPQAQMKNEFDVFNIVSVEQGPKPTCGPARNSATRADRLFLAGPDMTLDLILLQTFTGLALGSILVLMALGMSLIFGMLTVPNFAHGAFLHARRLCRRRRVPEDGQFRGGDRRRAADCRAARLSAWNGRSCVRSTAAASTIRSS